MIAAINIGVAYVTDAIAEGSSSLSLDITNSVSSSAWSVSRCTQLVADAVLTDVAVAQDDARDPRGSHISAPAACW